jgi:hypothetical protein
MDLTNKHETVPSVRMQNESTDLDWPLEVYRQLKAADVRLNYTVPVPVSAGTSDEESLARRSAPVNSAHSAE